MIKGKLDAFFETGTEGIIWSVYEDGRQGYDALNCLENGDFLRIFNPEYPNEVVWEGRIDYNWEINYRPYPLNPQYGQQEVHGYWVRGLQKDVVPEDWGAWFFKQYPAELKKTELGHFYPVKSSSISAYSWQGTGGRYGKEGVPGDLVLKFKNGGYYKYKDVLPEIFWAFEDAESKGKYFFSNIKDKFVTEKINLE